LEGEIPNVSIFTVGDRMLCLLNSKIVEHLENFGNDWTKVDSNVRNILLNLAKCLNGLKIAKNARNESVVV